MIISNGIRKEKLELTENGIVRHKESQRAYRMHHVMQSGPRNGSTGRGEAEKDQRREVMKKGL